VPPILVLASASPRRAQILRTLGLAFDSRIPHVDESLRPGEGGPEAALRLARSKAFAVSGHDALPVLAADTLVLCRGSVLGKPGSPAEAASMLRELSGRTHEVVTGVCLRTQATSFSGIETTQVSFAQMREEEVAWYVSTGEPMDKAGAYHIDGQGARFVVAVSGSPSNVAGLPVRLVLRLLSEAGTLPMPGGRP